jgi:hypothetical protein
MLRFLARLGNGRFSRERKFERRDEPPDVDDRRCDVFVDDAEGARARVGAVERSSLTLISSPLLSSRVDAAGTEGVSPTGAATVEALGVLGDAGAFGSEDDEDDGRGLFIPDCWGD